jgi:hypothetical protein
MTKIQMVETSGGDFHFDRFEHSGRFEHSDFEFVSDFVLRISDFLAARA